MLCHEVAYVRVQAHLSVPEHLNTMHSLTFLIIILYRHCHLGGLVTGWPVVPHRRIRGQGRAGWHKRSGVTREHGCNT